MEVDKVSHSLLTVSSLEIVCKLPVAFQTWPSSCFPSLGGLLGDGLCPIHLY